MLDHPLSYALTATADVSAVYLQQFWKTVSKVPDTKDTIRFKLLDKIYHSIKDDIPLVSVYSTENVLFRGMQIPDAFLTNAISATDDYKEYETVFVGVEVPINQPQPVVSTQGTHRNTPRAHRIPTLIAASPHVKKRKQSVGETSSPRKSLKVTIRQKKQSDVVKFALILKLNLSTLMKFFLWKRLEKFLVTLQQSVARNDVFKNKEMIEEERQRLNTTLNLYRATSSSTAKTSTAALQHQLYLKMKSKPQDQAADPELWEILKAKFEKP
ncbi:hypothetical protein Tco_0949546 [Tanacetum coccineum]